MKQGSYRIQEIHPILIKSIFIELSISKVYIVNNIHVQCIDNLAAVHFWQRSLAFKQRNYFKYVACTIWNIWGFFTFINRAIIFREIKSPRGRGSVCVHLISFLPFSFRPFQNAPLFPKFFWFRSPVPIAKCVLFPQTPGEPSDISIYSIV